VTAYARTARVWRFDPDENAQDHIREVGRIVLEGDRPSIGLTSDGDYLRTASPDGTVSVWESTGREALSSMGGDEYGSVVGIALSPDGRRLMPSAGAPGTREFQTWEVSTGKPIPPNASSMGNRFEAAEKPVVFSRDGKYVVTAGEIARVRR